MNNIKLHSEQIIINALVTEPNCIHDVMSKVTTDMFDDPVNKVIFTAITSLYINHNPINLVTVYSEIKKQETMYKQKAKEELTRLHSLFTYLDKQELGSCMQHLIAENIRHEHIDLGKKISTLSESESYDPKEIIDVIQNHIVNNKFKSILNKKEQNNKQLIEELNERMLSASQHEGINGIRTGYNRIDFVTSGMQPTNLIIVAARPAMGKTQFALGIMKNASIRNNKKGLFISCEMDEVQVMKRIVSVDSGIPGYHIKRGVLMRNELLRYDKSCERIAESNLKIVAGAFTISDVLSLVYKMKYAEGLDYVVIDYIQKITSPGSQNRTNEVGDVSRKLKDMANELKIPVVALAQLSRAVELRTDRKPQLSDLRESGDIEQDADIVMFLYRAGYYMDIAERSNNPLADDGYVIIAKHRDGELEDIHLKFDSNIPAWKNPNDKDEEQYVQSSLKPNKDFDWSGSQPF
jgi:replicative DNA helicase